MEEAYNKLFLRQLKRHFGSPDNIPVQLAAFIHDINGTYQSFEDDIMLLQHSLDLSSQELGEAFQKKKQDADSRKEIIDKIKAAIFALNPSSTGRQECQTDEDTDFLFESLLNLIRQRQQMEISLKENEFYLREILDSQDVGVTIIDLETHEISFINKKGAALYGAEKEAIIGQVCYEFICPTRCGDCGFSGELDNHVSLEKTLLTAKGEQIPVIKSVVHANFNNRRCLVESFVDITELKKAEAAIIRAKEEAIAASHAKSEFLANMSHEIRTPLNGVIGFSDLLMKSELNSTQLQYMQTVYYSANSLLDLLNDILDFSKIEAGKLELLVEKTDIIDLSEQIIDMMRFKAHEKGLELLLNVPVDIPRFVFTDPVRLRQILVNLLGNALKFTDEGEVELQIEMYREETDTSSAHFTFGIRDTGIGIPKDKQHKIFESFSQADNTTTRKYGGTGLGLAISARLVEMMGSSLLIESEEGLGSRFFFTVDLKTEEGEPLDRQNFSHISKVLIVDDNETNRLILQRMLDGVGIKSDMAENGVEALSLVGGNNGYDVVIMDYNMPGMNGIETIRSIRNRIGLPKPEQPVIFLHSSSDDQEIRNESQKLGVSHAVIKPVKMSQLLAALTAVESKSAPAGVEPALNNDLQTVLHEAVNTYRIMIAEDNRTNMILARAIINRLLPGSEVIQAVNGAEAVENYRLYRPDFIFMDIQMPEMNGYDAVKQIREIESSGNRHCPVVALTAGTVKGEEARCIEAGMDDYISKPVVESTIERVIRTWLTHRSEIPQQSLNGLPEGGLLHFDYDILLNRLNGDKELVRVLLLDAINRYPGMAGNLRAAFQKENCMEVRLIAHSLKGAARSICCYGLADIATRIELLTGEDKSRLLGLLELLDEELKILLGDFRMIIHDEVPEEK